MKCFCFLSLIFFTILWITPPSTNGVWLGQRLSILKAPFLVHGYLRKQHSPTYRYRFQGIILDERRILISGVFCLTRYYEHQINIGVGNLAYFLSHGRPLNRTIKKFKKDKKKMVCIIEPTGGPIQFNARVQRAIIAEADVKKPAIGHKLFVAGYGTRTPKPDLTEAMNPNCLNYVLGMSAPTVARQKDLFRLAHTRFNMSYALHWHHLGSPVWEPHSNVVIGIVHEPTLVTAPGRQGDVEAFNYAPVVFLPHFREWIDTTIRQWDKA